MYRIERYLGTLVHHYFQEYSWYIYGRNLLNFASGVNGDQHDSV